MEAKYSFKENGGEDFNMIPCLNDDEKWVQTLSGLIKDRADTE